MILPAIAQLVEHLTVDAADIRWSLVRFRVAGFGGQVFQLWSGYHCIVHAYCERSKQHTAAKEESNPCMSPCPVGWSHVQAPAWLITACSNEKFGVNSWDHNTGGSAAMHFTVVCWALVLATLNWFGVKFECSWICKNLKFSSCAFLDVYSL